MPNETISSGATILCVARMSGKNITRDLIEHYFNIISPNAGSIRHVANELSLKSGKDLDWLRTKDIERFKFEKRIWLLPILHLRCETCIKSEMKELTEALIHINIDKAKKLIEDYVNEGPEYLFQKAMLFKVQHDYEKAEYLFDHIEKRYPEYSYGEYLNERGMNFLNLKNTTKAIHMLSRAVEIDDLNGRAISNLGWAFLSSSQYDKAKPILDKAIHKSDMIVTSLLNRSHLFYEIGENNFAEEDLKKAVNLCPYDRRCVNNVIKKYYDIS